MVFCIVIPVGLLCGVLGQYVWSIVYCIISVERNVKCGSVVAGRFFFSEFKHSFQNTAARWCLFLWFILQFFISKHCVLIFPESIERPFGVLEHNDSQ